MDLTSLIIVGTLAVLATWLAVRLPFAIFRNLQAGHRFRRRLAVTLDNLRLSRMLGVLGIDKDEYLHREPAVAIRQQMERCDACDAKQQCDEALADPGTAPDTLGFCANLDELKAVRDRERLADRP